MRGRGRKGTKKKTDGEQSDTSYNSDVNSAFSDSDYYTSDGASAVSKKGKKKIKFPFRKKKKNAGDSSVSSVDSSVISGNEIGVRVPVVNVAVQKTNPPNTPPPATRSLASPKPNVPTQRATSEGTQTGAIVTFPTAEKEPGSSEADTSVLGNTTAPRILPIFSHQRINEEDSLSGDESSVSSSGSRISSASWKLNTNIARTKFNLGQVYMVKRMHDKAQQSFEEALAARTKLHGSMHPEVAKVHVMLGKLAERREGSIELAKKHYQEALFIYSMSEMLQDEPSNVETYGKSSLTLETAQFQKEKELRKLEKKRSMRKMSKQAAAIEDIEELKARINEAKERVSVSAANEAPPFAAKRSTSGGSSKRSVADTTSYHSTEEDLDILSIGDESVNVTNQTWEECLAAADKYMFDRNYQLANKCLKTGLRLLLSSDKDPKQFNESLLSMDEDLKTYGIHNNTVGDVRWKMGLCESRLGNKQDALRHMQVSLRLLRPELGNHNQKIAQILSDHGDVYCQLSDFEQGLECYSECLSIRSIIFGDTHMDTLSILQKSLQTLGTAADSAVEAGNAEQAVAHRKELVNLLETKYDQNTFETKKEKTKQLILLAHVLLHKQGWEEALYHLEVARLLTNEFTGAFVENENSMSLLKAQTIISINNLQAFAYEKQKMYDEALDVIQEALVHTGELYGPNSEQYAKLLSSQGIIYAKMQRGDEAITNFKRSTTIYVSCQANVNYDDYLKTLDTMIFIYVERGQTGIAKMILQDKLATGIQFKGERSAIVATTYKELGIMNFQDEKYEDALRNFKQSVDIGTYVFRSDDENFISSLRYYAVTNDVLGNYDDALITYQQILDLVPDESKLPFHNAVSYICNQTGRYDEALQHLQSALGCHEAYENNDDEESVTEYNRLMKHLGNVYASIGKESDAFYCYDKVIEVRGSSKCLQDERLTSIFNKSKVLVEKNKLLKAKSVLKQGLHLAKNYQKSDHTKLLWSSLGTVEYRLGNYQKAIKCFKYAMTKEVHDGISNKNDIGMSFNMGLAYWKLGLSYNAITVFQKCLEELESLDSDKANELAELKADILYNMGNMYLKENQLKEANQFFVKAIHSISKKSGCDQSVILRSRHSLALIICKEVKNNKKDTGSLDDAINIFRRVQSEIISTHGEEHVDVYKIYIDIAVALYLQGKYEESKETLDDSLTGLQKIVGESHPYVKQGVRLQSLISRRMVMRRVTCRGQKRTPVEEEEDS